MAIKGQVNRYFQNYSHRGEQRLYEALTNESISIHGIGCYYVARTFHDYDKLYGTDASSSYDNAWLIAVYLRNLLGFTGDREFLEKFAGLQIRDQVIFSISRMTFQEVIASDSRFPPLPNDLIPETNAPGAQNIGFTAARPREGDIIWFPFDQKPFKIVYVNKTDMFWRFGKLYTWEVTCELFEYSGEAFNTGIPAIDRIQLAGDLNVLDYMVTDTDGTTPLMTDPEQDWWVTDRLGAIYPLQDNVNINQEANTYIDWNSSDVDPFTAANTGPQSPTI